MKILHGSNDLDYALEELDPALLAQLAINIKALTGTEFESILSGQDDRQPLRKADDGI